MAQKGTTISNPLSGEQVTWRETSAETAGARTVGLFRVRPGGGVPVLHFHPHSSERFTVEHGSLTVVLDGAEHTLGEGESIVAPPRSPHSWRNDSAGALEVVIEYSPAGHFEELLELAFQWAREGKVGKDGRPTILRAAALLDAYRDDGVYLSPPIWMQRLLTPPLAWLGRRLHADTPRRPAT